MVGPFNKMFCFLLQIPREYYKNGKPKGNKQFYHPTFDTKTDTRCFPLSYNLGKDKLGLEPNPNYCCDLPTCLVTQEINYVRHSCYHTFHLVCLPPDYCCPICKDPLEATVRKKVAVFNEGLLKNADMDEEEGDVIQDDGDEAQEVNLPNHANDAEEYYQSEAWKQHKENTVASFENVPPPEHVNAQSAQRQNIQVYIVRVLPFRQ